MTRLDDFRPVSALLLAGGAVALLVLSAGDVLVPAVLAGLGLRLWCGLPELRGMGASHRGDVMVEVVGGLAVTLLAMLVSRGTHDLPVEATLLSLSAVLLLLTPVLRLLRR